jgi:5'-deoxynucleotidase YfbR-like HD superfamily hydrolase
MTDTRPEPMLFELQKLVVDLALIDRNHHLINHPRSENDVEHSFATAMLAWFICSKYNLKLDQARLFKYALAHDFVERYAGDVNTFASDADRQDKIRLEKAALQRLSDEFAEFGDLVTCLRNYEKLSDEEALFVWSVDKLQAIILGELDGWRPYKKVNVSYESFVRKHSEVLEKGSPYIKEIYATLMEYFKQTYYDQPRKN